MVGLVAGRAASTAPLARVAAALLVAQPQLGPRAGPQLRPPLAMDLRS